ncbi:MAG: sigma-54 dependent transcriptional regulator, partial [Pseudomonadales bacterium]|nr:sigma-54 dependent transcriptional regulator [Pseudomonadales bacterium]
MTKLNHILIIEDKIALSASIKRCLNNNNNNLFKADSLNHAIEQGLSGLSLIIAETDLDGHPVTELIKLAPGVPVIAVSDKADLKMAISLIKRGAENYLVTPFTDQELIDTVAAILRDPMPEHQPETIIGRSESMKALFLQIKKVAPTNSSVLILGESGTGKELVAKAIHHKSDRYHEPLISLNCAAIPETLIEAELFGHERGAFTGATKSRMGLIEAADKGTLFLDEIGELPLEAQARLLRVLQGGEVRRIGSTSTLKVNIRLIAATHRDLLQLVEEKLFRLDLYYRLDVMQLKLPPLRERGNDLDLLADHCLKQTCLQMNKNLLTFSDKTRHLMSSYSWPGNIRELENSVARAVILCESQ